MGHLRVTVGHPRVIIGHLRVTMGHLRLIIGYLKAKNKIFNIHFDTNLHCPCFLLSAGAL